MKPDIKKCKLYESAMIKSIRRSNLSSAVSFAGALCILGFEDIVWKRIFIHLSEDIGPANFELPSVINSLYNNYVFLRNTSVKSSYESGYERCLPIAHAIILMCQSNKSRIVNDSVICEFKVNNWTEKEIPDYAIDLHSPKGRRMGRDVKHFIDEAGKIYPESDAIINIWKSLAENYLLKNEK